MFGALATRYSSGMGGAGDWLVAVEREAEGWSAISVGDIVYSAAKTSAICW